jgi:hypothetical protein
MGLAIGQEVPVSGGVVAVISERRPVGEVCPLCGGEGEPLGTVEGVCVRQCCGTLLSWAWESEQAYLGFYQDIRQFHEGQQETEGHPTTIARDGEHLRASRSRVKILHALYPYSYGTRILDVGAGGGSFVKACSEVCIDALGLEPCAALAHWARQQGRTVECGGWQDVNEDWEVICLHDVLEHLTNPASCLCYLRAHLSEGGLMVVEMPEWESSQAKWENLRWRHVLPKQHVCLYSDRAAQELFKRCGLSVEAIVRPLRGTLGKITYYLGRV